MPAPTRSHVHRRRRRAAAFLALGVAVVGVAAIALVVTRAGGKPGPDEAAGRFVTAWNRGDDAGAARVTDRPAAAAAALAANRRGLDGAAVTARVGASRSTRTPRPRGSPSRGTSRASARYAYRSAPASAGAKTTLDDRVDPEGHPPAAEPHAPARHDARRGARAGTSSTATATRSSAPRTVYRVGLQRDKVARHPRLRRRARRSGRRQPRALARAVRGAGPKQFVEAITLREGDYRRVEDALDAVPAALAVQTEAPLAESRGFARALLGGVGPATAEQLERLGDTRGAGDQVGQSGLQARYEAASAPPRRARS